MCAFACFPVPGMPLPLFAIYLNPIHSSKVQFNDGLHSFLQSFQPMLNAHSEVSKHCKSKIYSFWPLIKEYPILLMSAKIALLKILSYRSKIIFKRFFDVDHLKNL